MSAGRDELSEEPGTFLLSRLSNEMVRLYKDQFGRGPTRARSYWCGPDTLVVLLEDTLTQGERNLVAMEEHQRLRDTRTFLQYATVREFCEPVERLTGRTVRAFVSGIDTAVEGFSVETFALHPSGSDAPSRAER
ncbi:MAG TPA: Na-translocating system protein MpsC family protein [Solirubrobacteraceae bacterium]|nr:Na-translocating system protein MpsC family protein [Solirubrobacteraceae bacterium]